MCKHAVGLCPLPERVYVPNVESGSSRRRTRVNCCCRIDCLKTFTSFRKVLDLNKTLSLTSVINIFFTASTCSVKKLTKICSGN